MKAWQYTSAAGGLEKNLKINNEATGPSDARLGKNQILVEVLSMSVNPVDYKIPELGALSKVMIRTPASPGLDFCGKVVATHTINDSLQTGQLVFGRLDGPTQFGTLGQHVVASSEGCVSLPKNVDVDHAAALGTAALTAFQCIVPYVKGISQPRVFINGGSGGTGIWGIQIAKKLGAYVITSCSTGNVALCKELGADEVLDYKKEDILTGLKSKGQTLDLVVDNVGSPPNLYKESEHFLNATGRFVQVGAEPSLSASMNLAGRMFRPSFLGGGSRAFTYLLVKNRAEDFNQLGQWLSQGAIKPVIEKVYEWEDAPKAFERLKSGRTVGKLVVHVMANKN